MASPSTPDGTARAGRARTQHGAADAPSASPSITEITGASSRSRRPLDLSGRVVLLATDGSDASAGAARVAAALADLHHAEVHAVTVTDVTPAPLPPPLDLALAMGDALAGPEVHAERVREIRSSLEAAIGAGVAWPVRSLLGVPGTAIAMEAKRLGAVLIVVGLRPHGRVERAFNDETVLGLMQRAACPVLAIVPDATELPRRVLVAIDFSETSLIAARTAAAVAPDGSTLLLAYVPPTVPFIQDGPERMVHELGVEAAFARITQDLERPGVRFDHVVLHHEGHCVVSKRLLEHAVATRADLVAAGAARHGRLERWMMGSVSTELVHDGRQSLLIVPPSDRGAD